MNLSLPVPREEFLPWSPVLLGFNLSSYQGLGYPVLDPPSLSRPRVPSLIPTSHPSPPSASPKLFLPPGLCLGSSFHPDAVSTFYAWLAPARPSVLRQGPPPPGDPPQAALECCDTRSLLHAPSIAHPPTGSAFIHLCDSMLPGLSIPQVRGWFCLGHCEFRPALAEVWPTNPITG